MAGIKVEFPAALDPVTLADAKTFLRVDNITDDDVLIQALISAATITCETYTRRSFIQKGFLQTLDSFPYFTDTMLSQLAFPPSYYSLPRYSTTLWNYSQMIKLFRPPLISLDRITYCSSADQMFHDLVPQPSLWYPQTVYSNGQQAMDGNGNIQTLFAPSPSMSSGKSGINPPGIPGHPGPNGSMWNQVLGGTTVEAAPATAIWINGGPASQGEFGAFIMDNVSEPARIFPGVVPTGPSAGFWPSVLYVPNAVQIHFTAGYGPNPADVPQNIRVAIMLTVSDCYENREPVPDDGEQLPKHVRQLLAASRVLDLAPTRG